MLLRTLLFLVFCLIIHISFAQDAPVVSDKAYLAFERGDYVTAKTYYEAALNKENTLEVKEKLGQCYVRLGKPDEAIQLYREILANTSNTYTTARLYTLLGEAHLNKNDNSTALESLEKAEVLYTSKNKNTLGLAVCYNTTGLVHWNNSNPNEALAYLQRGLDLRKQLTKEQSKEVAASYNDLGLVHSSLGETEKALDYYQAALEIYEKVYISRHPKIAVAYGNVGVELSKQQDYQRAITQLNKSLRIWKAIYPQKHPSQAFVITNIAQCYAGLKEYGEALLEMKEALTIYQQSSVANNPEIANVHNLIGDIYSKTGEYALALEQFQAALQANAVVFQEVDYTRNPASNDYYKGNVLLNSLLLKAQTLEDQYFVKSLKLNDLKLAFQTLQVADTLANKLRQTTANKEDKLALAAITSELYQDGVRVALALAGNSFQRTFYQTQAFYFA
ncbi:MAG: tetratricopeptide repeat protein, partial [Bacteroidota bacterium]